MTRKPKTNASTTTVQLGLAAALGDGSTTKPEVTLLNLDRLRGIPLADMKRYEKDEWNAFLQSIREGGLEQPIIVRPAADGIDYEIVEGRHRALAFQQLRLTEIPCIVRKDYDAKSAAVAEFVTNHQRKAATPLQEARAFQAAITAGLTQDDVAKRAGVSVTTVRNRLQILQLPESLAARVGDDLRMDNLEELVEIANAKDIPQGVRDQALQAAAKVKGSYGHEDAARKSVADGTHRAWLDEKLTGDYYLQRDEKLVKLLAKVPQVDIGRRTLFLDAPAAKTIIKDFKEKHRTSSPNSSRGGARRDIESIKKQREKNRVQKIQLDLLAKKLTGAISYGREWTDALLLRYVDRLGLIASRKAEREAFEAVTGIKGWSGRGENLVAHIRKAKLGTVAAGRLLHAALFFDLNNKMSYSTDGGVPKEYAMLLLGKSRDAIVAQAKREVAAVLKEESTKESKGGKKGHGKPSKGKAKPAVAVADDDVDDGLVDEDLEADLEA